ncbi:MAG: autotransporter-associated beta strand repeat-containing protein, partial [Candidatus Nanoarchaeia archaeon]
MQRKCWAGGRVLSAVAAFGATMIVGFGLQAQTLYWGGGTSDISDGTPLPNTPTGLTGTWNDSLKNWSNAYSPTVYQTWTGGAFANLGYFVSTTADVAITVDGNKTLSGMFATLTAANATNRRFAFNGSSSGTTLTLTGDYATFLIDSSDSTRRIEFNSSNTNLSFGSSSTTLIKDGGGSLQLGSAGGVAFNGNALTGNILIRSGSVNIANASSSLNGVQTFDIIGYRPSINYADANGNQGFTMPTLPVVLPNSSSNRLNDNAVITLKRGQFELRGGGTSAVENIGSIVLEGTGLILNSQGTAGSTWNVGTLSRGSNGRGTAVMTVTTSDVLQHNVRITDPGATSIPTDVLLPWFSTNRAEWVMIDSSNNNQITRIAATTAATDVSTWDTTYGGTDNLRVNATLTGTLDANLAINSLGFLNGTTLDLGTYTLTLNSGALGFSGVTPTIQNGNLTTNSVPLYINGGWTNSGGLNLNAKLTGNMDIYYTGQTTLTIGGTAGANDYTGTMYIQSGTVNANKAGAINGNVVVNTGAGLQIVNVSGIASGANVTIQKDGLLRVSASTKPTLTGALTINDGVVSMGTQSLRVSGGLAFNGGVINSATTGTTVRQLELMSDVSYASSSETQAVIQWNPDGAYTSAGFNVQLSPDGGSATRTFTIADSTNHDKADMLIDVPIINGAGTSPVGSLVKEGNGVLQLTAANTYTGTTTVNAGTLHLARIQAATQSGLTGTFTNSGITGHILTFVNPITSTMAVGQTVSGTNIAANRVIAKILNDYQAILSGNVGSTGNTYATDIALGAVDRAGSLASEVTVNSGGTLLLDEGTTVNNTVTVNNGGSLQGKGTVTGGVSVNGTLTPGTSGSPGTLNLSSTLTFGAGSVLYFRLGTVSDKISFATASDNLVGSGNVTLSLILGSGFSYANTYTIFENTTTEGFTFASIVGYDTANYTAVFQKSCNNYVLSFT